MKRPYNESLHKHLPDFGDYVLIEQKRYGGENEMYLHKVIRSLSSNSYVDVPVDGAGNFLNEVLRDECVDVVSCICCGVDETKVRKYRLSDVRVPALGDSE